MKNKKAGLLQQTIIHLIIIGLLFALFFGATSARASSRGVKQQVIEKQTALLIDSAFSDTTFILSRTNRNGYIDDIKIENGKIFVSVNGLKSILGYPFFSKYAVSITKDNLNFFINIK